MSSLAIGIVGLPNAGKSTLFNALLSRRVAQIAAYPFCTIEPNVGVVAVPDPRLDQLSGLYPQAPVVPAAVEFFDIAGLVKGAHQGEGLGNKFLAHIRETRVIVQVVRAFELESENQIDPISDREVIKLELCLADLQTLEKQTEPKGVVTKEQKEKWQLILTLRQALSQGKGVNELALSKEEKQLVSDLSLLTAKPVLLVLNVNEEELKKPPVLEGAITISAKVEMELADLNDEERQAYLDSLGLQKSGLERLIQAAYSTLGLQTFFTVGDKEVRAWTIKKAAKAPQAAGVIHTDFEKGFIKAMVINWRQLLEIGSWGKAKELGKLRMEGKDYVFQDGDVVEFRFN